MKNVWVNHILRKHTSKDEKLPLEIQYVARVGNPQAAMRWIEETPLGSEEPETDEEVLTRGKYLEGMLPNGHLEYDTDTIRICTMRDADLFKEWEEEFYWILERVIEFRNEDSHLREIIYSSP